MFQWYENAEVCYAYLADVPVRGFSESRWFTRGWTLQELIAPMTVVFLDQDWKEIGTKDSLKEAITACTGIPGNILDGDDLESASVAQRMSWAAKRETTRPEDRAYSLLGLFGVNIPMVYGEGERAFIRLQEEIFRISEDQSLFAWRSSDGRGGLFATHPGAFAESGDIVGRNKLFPSDSAPIVSSRGVHLELPFIGIGHSGLGLALLECGATANDHGHIALYLRDEDLTMQNFRRVQARLFENLDLLQLSLQHRPRRKICVRIGHTLRPSKRFPRKTLHDRGGSDLCDFIRPSLVKTKRIAMTAPKALREAAKAGDEHAVRQLLWSTTVAGNIADGDGLTPLLHAAATGQTGMVWLLLTQIDVQPLAVDNRGLSILHYAIMNGHEALAKMLLGRRDTLELQGVETRRAVVPCPMRSRGE